MSPHPTLLPCPTGQPPLKVIGAARAPGAAHVISPSEGVHAVSAQQRGFGHGVASGPQVSVALPALRPVAPPDALRAAVADHVAGRRSKSPAKSKLLRCCASTPVADADGLASASTPRAGNVPPF